jgi:hypothetical protein
MRQTTPAIVASLKGLIAGLRKNRPKRPFAIAGSRYTAPQLIKICESILALIAAVPPARARYRDAVSAVNAIQAKHRGVLRDLKHSIQVQAGGAADALSDYGLSPRKKTGMRSPKVKVAAADKAAATRAARHTQGPKQKKLFKGSSPPNKTAPQAKTDT